MANPISNRSLLPFPAWGVVSMYRMVGRSNYNGLQTVFTKRLSHRWQGTLTYTLSTLKDSDPQPVSGLTEVPFAVARNSAPSTVSVRTVAAPAASVERENR